MISVSGDPSFYLAIREQGEGFGIKSTREARLEDTLALGQKWLHFIRNSDEEGKSGS